ncbi:MAG: hypothetical protein D6798_11640 [Deltaproteobacteria bacterium]|nr:MAG: hypothetical protein D6798_11640 [Deltaproteobacteria bacterium]
MMRAMIQLLLVLLLAFSPSVHAQDGTPPVVDERARLNAVRIASMPDSDPVSRLLMLLEARKADDATLYALATMRPDIVEQAVVPRYKRAVAWIETLPASELYRMRQGETIIRNRDLWRGEEEARAIALGTSFGFKEKKLLAIRIGPLEGRVIRVEVNAKGRGGTIDKATVELAWPSTPTRDEESRDTLSKYFGARPSRVDTGAGSLLPLVDGSFEEPDTLTTNWQLEDAVVLGVRSPVSDVRIDRDVHLDGNASLRVYNTAETRLFQAVVQRVEIVPGMRLQATTHHKTDNVRAEFQQNEGDLYLSMTFEDLYRQPIGPPLIGRGRLATHGWEPIEVTGVAPPDAAWVRIALVSALSGTTWFDGTSLSLQ